jgi:hypothetical protein
VLDVHGHFEYSLGSKKGVEFMSSRLSKIWLAAPALMTLGLAAEAGAQTNLAFYPVSPCRLWDTRGPAGPSGGPAHNANTSRSFPVRGVCGVPTTAQAIAVNLTVTFGTLPVRDLGNMRAYPAGTTAPLASVLNWTAADNALANGAIVPLGTSGANHITIQIDMPVGSAGQIHSLADVTGYFQ